MPVKIAGEKANQITPTSKKISKLRKSTKRGICFLIFIDLCSSTNQEIACCCSNRVQDVCDVNDTHRQMRPSFRKMGRGVKKRLVARANRTIANAKPAKLSCLREPSHGNPSKALDEPSTPRWVYSSFFSMLTKRLSKIINGISNQR